MKKWNIPTDLDLEKLGGFPEHSSTQAQILLRRGIHSMDELEAFIDAGNQPSPDPASMAGMDVAVQILKKAIRNQEQVIVYGDYDADGVCATAMLIRGLQAVGGNVDAYIPDRFREGYGLNQSAVERIAADGGKVLVTVDCGTRAVAETELARSKGMDVIITDHHLVGEVLPGANVILNPNQPEDEFPYKEMAGTGVAYQLLMALQEHFPGCVPAGTLSLVAIGTVADLVPLIGENRRLVIQGLEELNKAPYLGIRELIDIAGYSGGSISSNSIAFGLGPRINAAGRVESANTALQLLLTGDIGEAEEFAARLNDLNKKRQDLTQAALEKAREDLQAKPTPIIIMSFESEYHEGVVGLTASRLLEEFYRPAVVGRKGEEISRASARSIKEFDITAALEECADLLVRFGGHAAAAGFSIRTDDIVKLEARLRRIAGDRLIEADLKPSIDVDAVVELGEVDWELLEFIEKLEPFGSQNSAPVFAAQNVQLMDYRKVGKDRRHLKLTLESDMHRFDGIAFRQGDLADGLGRMVDVAFKLERNEYLGYESLQLNVQDIRSSDISNKGS